MASLRSAAALLRPSLGTTSTRGLLYYQSKKDLSGSDGEFFGVDPVPVEVEIQDGRGMGFTLDDNGFCLLPHEWDHVDYNDNDQVVNKYYAECEAIVRRQTGASRVLAFDHNVRAKQRKDAGGRLRGGSAVQEPLITYGVHNDYTLTSAPNRIQQLAQPARSNDTYRADGSPIKPEEVETLLKGRWMFINVWRSITDSPVERFPLAACDAQSVVLEDLVVFEIRYADRVGENYFARHSKNHRWYYFPRMIKDEVMLLKCWDSRGKDFQELELPEGKTSLKSVPATFSLHSAFDDFATPPQAPDRESIEIRTIAFFEE
ncbi:unnamed protein product [Polarella glacialis]|uniref:Uncharacterized protein n=1 Tax=Polarella glacialis TaxID=89957 RepID=A0A813HIB9_POLGL|nr:unnamed protein product [Polarella glacialis]